MPGVYGTDPREMWPKAGWGCGPCFGPGVRRRFAWNRPQSKEDQRKVLTEYREALEEELEEIKKEEQELAKEE